MLLQGTWRLVSAWDNGVQGLANGNRVTVTLQEWTATGLTFNYRLDSARTPKQIDWVHKGQVWKGIYELTPDRLRLCVSPPGQSRPTEFVTRPGDRRQLHVRKRAPAGEKAAPK